MRYHRSPKTGTYQICRAKNKCPYGGFHTESLPEIIEYCNQYNDILNMPLEKNKELAERDEESYDLYRTVLCERVKATGEHAFSLDSINVSDYLEDNAGASIDVKGNKYVTNGFSVSPYPEYSLGLDIENMPDEEFKSELKDYMKQHKDILSKENHILGLWKSPFDKKLYVDISIVCGNAKECRVIGADKDQQAYFDFQTFSAITINANATSGQISTTNQFFRKKIVV